MLKSPFSTVGVGVLIHEVAVLKFSPDLIWAACLEFVSDTDITHTSLHNPAGGWWGAEPRNSPALPGQWGWQVSSTPQVFPFRNDPDSPRTCAALSRSHSFRTARSAAAPRDVRTRDPTGRPPSLWRPGVVFKRYPAGRLIKPRFYYTLLCFHQILLVY